MAFEFIGSDAQRLPIGGLGPAKTWAFDLAPIKTRAEAATPEPWHFMCDLQALECAGDDILVTMSDRRPKIEDANFIDNARSDVPALIEEMEKLRTVMDFIDSPNCPTLWAAVQAIRKVKSGSGVIVADEAELPAGPIDTDALREVAEALQSMSANLGIDVSLDDRNTNAGLVNLAADRIDSLTMNALVARESIEAERQRTTEATLELRWLWRQVREAYEAFSGDPTKHKACEILENAIMGTVDEDENHD